MVAAEGWTTIIVPRVFDMIHYHNFEQGWFHPARSISLMAVRLGFVWLSLRRVHICLRHPQPLLCCCSRLPIFLTSVPLDCVRGPLLLIEGSGDQRRAPRGSQCAHVRGGGGTSGRCPGTISIMNSSCKLCYHRVLLALRPREGCRSMSFPLARTQTYMRKMRTHQRWHKNNPPM